MTWHLLLEVGVRRITACELLCRGERKVLRNHWKVVAPDVDECGSSHLWWPEEDGVCEGHFVFPMGFSSATYRFLHSSRASWRWNLAKANAKLLSAQFFFFSISKTLEYIYILKTSIASELTDLIRLRIVFTSFDIKRKYITFTGGTSPENSETQKMVKGVYFFKVQVLVGFFPLCTPQT